jgi:hypothetical protein
MKYCINVYIVLLLAAFAFNVGGCSRFSQPSDEEAIKVINDTGLFSGGVEKFSLKSPIVILEKKRRNSDGSWQVKIKATVTFTMAGGKETAPKERTLVFRLFKSKDGSGKIVWKAGEGS